MSRRAPTLDPLARHAPAPDRPFELEPEPQPKPKRPIHAREPRLTKRERYDLNFAANRACPPEPEETWFRHTHWEHKRTLVRQALADACTGARQLEAFDYCGAQCVVEFCAEENKFRVRADYCRNRHCEPCARAKANLLAANLRSRLELYPNARYRFLTITLKHSNEPLTDQIKRLYACFKELRETKMWKNNVTGGCASFEAKWSVPKNGPKDAPREWHPHLHIVMAGDPIKKERIAEAWHQITGDSYIIDIKEVDSGKDAAYYVSKYVSKGTNGEVWHDHNARIEWVIATKGLRTCNTFGTWRGFKLLGHDADTRHWKPIGTLRSIVQAAREGEVWAIGTLKSLVADVQYNPHKPRGKRHDADAEDLT